jgi:hypothetical protein
VAGRHHRDATGHGEPAQGDEENDAEKNSEKENLDAGLSGTHCEKESGGETKRDNESDNGESEHHVSARG